jgi:LuxR family maltose regulon positive regulatory protein
VAPDVVCRTALHERLNAGLELPLTLVSAPAGYGKSTLISHWLEKRNVPLAWVSLDGRDSDSANIPGLLYCSFLRSISACL